MIIERSVIIILYTSSEVIGELPELPKISNICYTISSFTLPKQSRSRGLTYIWSKTKNLLASRQTRRNVGDLRQRYRIPRHQPDRKDHTWITHTITTSLKNHVSNRLKGAKDMITSRLTDVQDAIVQHLSYSTDPMGSSLRSIRESLSYRGFSLSLEAVYDYLVELIKGSYVNSSWFGKRGYRYTLTEKGKSYYSEHFK